MKSFKSFIAILITLIIVIYTGRYFTANEMTLKLDNDTLSTTADSTVSKLTLKQFGVDGALINQLTSPSVKHIPKGNVHLFETPHIVITQDKDPSWEIHSVKAKSVDGGKSITFIQHVVVHQNPGASTQESTLKTEKITYYPNEKKATTNQFVTFEQPGNTIQSMGMNAYLDEKRVELLHKAKGIYDPANG